MVILSIKNFCLQHCFGKFAFNFIWVVTCTGNVILSNNLKKLYVIILFLYFYISVIQFGFITIFVAAFPLAPFFALANNVFEIRIDSNKLICETRRPIADRAQDLGIWFDILNAVAKIAVISNVSSANLFIS